MTHPSSVNSKVDFVLVTALPEELDAVLKKLPGYKKLSPANDDIRTYFQVDLPVTFPDNSTGKYRIIVMCFLDMGRLEAATATADAIRRWRPRYILLVGIAGGMATRNVRIGDILIADQIVDYELQKLTSAGPQIRWNVHRAYPRLLDACNNYRDESWQKSILIERPDNGEPKRHTGPIACGDKVITFSEILEGYRNVWPKLIGVEMEAAGVATAAFQSPDGPGFFMVRGVSDLADESKSSGNVEKWRSYACATAASFAVALLKSGPVPLPKKTIKVKKKRVEIILKGEFDEFTPNRQQDIVGVLAALLKIHPTDIEVLRVSRGSIVVVIEMLDSAANRLYEMAIRHDFRIINLGIQSILVQGKEIIKLADTPPERADNRPEKIGDKKRSVLIVDDQENWLELLKEVLEKKFEVSVSKDYNNALEQLSNREYPFHVLVTDLRLVDEEPGNEDGLKLIEYLNQRGGETKTIVITGYPTIRTAKRALSHLGAYDYFEKRPSDGSPFDIKEFQRIVYQAAEEAENNRNKSDIFVLMPFAPKYKETYTLLQEVANELKLTCKRSDDIPTPGSIMEQVEKSIERSKIIIADLTDKNPNVYFETGISDAKMKPVILLANNENDLAKNLEGNRVILYENSFKGARDLKAELKKQIKFILSNKGQNKKLYSEKEGSMPKFCLAITADNKAGEDTYKSIIQPVVIAQKIECKYVWGFYKVPNTKDAPKIIKDNLQSASLIVTDLTGRDADVYYLSGFAFGLNIYPVILYDKQEEIPFGIRTIGKIPYLKDTEDHRDEARKELTEAIKKHGTAKNISQGAIMNKIKVFINHATEDKPLVRKLYSELKKYPWIDPWFDEEKLLPGQDWKLEISKALKNADAVLICMSKISVQKTGYVQAEIYKAQELQKLRPPGHIYMTPVLLEECPIPENLQEYHWVNISEPGKFELLIKGLETLMK